MTITSYGTGAYRSAKTSELVTTRTQLDDLQRQLTTQKRSETYGGLGVDRRISLDINAKVSAIDSWLSGIERAQVNLKLQSQAVEGIAKMASSIRTDISTSSYIPMSGGRTGPQILAEDKFSQAIDLLNIDVNGRYLFSGRATDEKTAENAQVILYGDGNGRAGLEQLIKERAGADGLVAPALTGRLDVGGGPGVIEITKAVNDDYGFKLRGLTIGTESAGAVSGPPGLSVTLVAQPLPGETVRLDLELPDGTRQVITLTAGGDPSTGDGFQIGADVDVTADSIRAALDTALKREAQTSLKAASAVRTAEDFFTQNPPPRVDPTFVDAPTASPVGSGDTVIWYRGDTSDPAFARTTASVQVDKTQTLSTGTQANERGITATLAQLAVLALVKFPQTETTSQAGYNALTERVRDNLGYEGTQKPSEILIELGGAQNALKDATARHQATKSYLQTTVAKIEQVDTSEVALQILSLQTSLDASYRVTSILAGLSLTKFL